MTSRTVVAARRIGVAGLLAAAASCVPASDRARSVPPATSVAVPQPRATIATEVRARLDGPAEQGALVRGQAAPGTVSLTLDDVPVTIAPDGAFAIAFDRDAGGSATLREQRRDRGLDLVGTRTIAVAPRAWRIQRLPTLARIPVPSADFARRRPAELARIAAARARDTGAQGWRQRFAWPVTGRISGVFGSQRIYRGEPGSYHSGVDVARPTGTPVVAPADGVVILAAASPFTLEGNLLMIDHGAGLNSAFLHLSRIDVGEGQTARRGERIGAIGATGRATGPHLHWSMQWRGRRIDPAPLAGAM